MTTAKRLLVVIALCAMALPAMAWGPKTQMGVVNSAVHVISQDGSMPLKKLRTHVLEGAELSSGEMAGLFPTGMTAPLGAIESEMYLLQAVRGDSVDVYYAYRLGALGRLVAEYTTPMGTAGARHKTQYDRDIDAVVGRLVLNHEKRRLVDPKTYFRRVMTDIEGRTDVILRDYQDGIGFDGIAKTAAAEDVSLSVNCVADVWYTILSGSARSAAVSNSQVTDYLLKALRYYVDANRDRDIDRSYARLLDSPGADIELRKRIGDLFYDAGRFDRSMAEYEAVLTAEPHRRDVVARVAEYYVMVGDEALEQDELQRALDFYTRAVQRDQLHPDAQRKVLATRTMIDEREARLATAQNAVERADGLTTEAERRAMSDDFAGALKLLDDAEDIYYGVTDEFPTIAQAADRGLKNVKYRRRQFKDDLINNAQTLSGSGFAMEDRRRDDHAKAIAKEGIQTLLDAAFNDDIAILENEMKAKMQ